MATSSLTLTNTGIPADISTVTSLSGVRAWSYSGGGTQIATTPAGTMTTTLPKTLILYLAEGVDPATIGSQITTQGKP